MLSNLIIAKIFIFIQDKNVFIQSNNYYNISCNLISQGTSIRNIQKRNPTTKTCQSNLTIKGGSGLKTL